MKQVYDDNENDVDLYPINDGEYFFLILKLRLEASKYLKPHLNYLTSCSSYGPPTNRKEKIACNGYDSGNWVHFVLVQDTPPPHSFTFQLHCISTFVCILFGFV